MQTTQQTVWLLCMMNDGLTPCSWRGVRHSRKPGGASRCFYHWMAVQSYCCSSCVLQSNKLKQQNHFAC